MSERGFAFNQCAWTEELRRKLAVVLAGTLMATFYRKE
jgi:hypothetical protein